MSSPPLSSLQVWLPAWAPSAATHPLRRAIVRADRLGDGAVGYLAGLGDYFPGVDASLPGAALTRAFLAGDAGDDCWLSADPAWLQPDLTGARLLACGQLQLDMDDAQALATPLHAVFAQAGMQLLVSTPDRWHLKLPPGTALPWFAPPEQALGEDLSQHLPQGAEGRRWRLLLNEIQVLLHQHPLNARRREQGLAPVNSLWLWGGGALPGPMPGNLRGVISDDLLLQSLAAHAGVAAHARSAQGVAAAGAGWLIDLQDLPAEIVARQWWPMLEPLLLRQPATLHFASGERWRHRPWHRWRVWRRVAG